MQGVVKLGQELMLMEAMASVSLSHDEDCPCDACRATAGDDEALGRVFHNVAEAMEWKTPEQERESES